MVWVRALLLLFLLTGTGQAQTIKVRSGEHGDFSRLVIYTRTPEQWSFGRVNGGYELRLSPPELTYDVSRIFDLIPRTRITAIDDLGRGRLKLHSDCNCHAKVFVTENGQIVVDITSGSAPESAGPFNAFLDEGGLDTERTNVTSDNAVAARLGLPLLPVSQIAEPMKDASARTEDPDAAQETHHHTTVSGNLDMVSEEPAQKSRVQQTELALIEQLGRAAAQGLVDANLSTLEAEVERVTRPIAASEADPDPERPSPPEPIDSLDENEHVAVQTSIDRESIEQKSIVVSTQEGMACLPDSEFAISSWGEEVGDGVDLARHKVGFLGEFDRPDQEIATMQARYLVYLTFGAEAKALIHRYRTEIRSPDILIQMAEVMDAQYSEKANELAPQMGCDGKTALWSALAQPRFRPGQEINKKSIIIAFSELPLHLRRHLGPGLAQKFLEFGDQNTAKALRNTLDRAGDDHGAGYELLEAQIELKEGNQDQAESRLTEIINGDSEMSPQAALDFVNARLAQNRPVPERIIEIASTYAYEQRETELGAELKMAEIRALAASSDFDTAFSQIEQGVSDQQLAPHHVERLHRELIEKIVENGSDSQFVRYSLGNTIPLQKLGMKLRTEISRRLLDLGFTGAARDFLDVEGNVPDADQRMIYAQIALKEFKPSVALGYLAGLESDDALMLRAEALTMSKDYKAASQLYHSLGVEDGRRSADWRSGEWQNLSEQTESPLHDASRLMLTSPIDPQTENQRSLSHSAELLETSENARAVLEKLLEDLPSP